MSSKNKQVKGLLLKVDNVVICEVEEIQAELGEPDCKIKNPYQYDKDAGLTPWPDFAGQTEMMLRSDDKRIQGDKVISTEVSLLLASSVRRRGL